MNKELREMLSKIQAKTEEAKGLMAGENKDVEKANSIMNEVDELQKEFDLAKKIYDQEKANGGKEAMAVVEPKEQKKEVEKVI
jgi:hypothetical protein